MKKPGFGAGLFFVCMVRDQLGLLLGDVFQRGWGGNSSHQAVLANCRRVRGNLR